MQAPLPSSFGRVSQCPLKWLVFGTDFSNQFHSLALGVISGMNNNVVLCVDQATAAETAHQQVECDTTNAKATADTIRYQDPNVLLVYGKADSTIKDDLIAVYNIAKAMTQVCNPLAPLDDYDDDEDGDDDKDGDDGEQRCRSRKTLIYVTTTAGLHGIPGRAMHCATHFAIEGLLESLYMELEPLGHRVVLFDTGSHDPTTVDDRLPAHLLACLPRLKSPNVPMRLAPGAAAKASVNAKLRWVGEEIEDWKFLYEN